VSGERLVRSLCIVVGVFLLADSVTQLVQAIGRWDIGSRAWRVGNLRLLFTQVTPLLLAWMLVLLSAVRTPRGWRLAAMLSWMCAILIIGLGLRLEIDSAAISLALNDGQRALHERASLQALMSASALVLGLIVTGWIEFRTGRAITSPST
jgi:hypothetical protein